MPAREAFRRIGWIVVFLAAGLPASAWPRGVVAEFSEEPAAAGQGVDLLVNSLDPAGEVSTHCPELGWERVRLEPRNRDRVEWLARLEVPKDALGGRYEVLVVVRRQAGKSLERVVTIQVRGSSWRDDEPA